MRVDHAIGADRLKPGMRAQLLFEQIEGVGQMTPVISAGAFAVSLLILFMTFGSPGFPSVLVWGAALYFGLFVAVRGWLRVRQPVWRKTTSPPRAVRKVLINAALMGVIWGTLPIIVLPADDSLITATIAIVLAGVLCATSFALLILPQAALVFSFPLLAGSFLAFICFADPAQCLPLAAVLAVYTLVLGFVCIRYARNLVDHLVSEAKIREQKDIISLLLKEFEENSSDWLWEFDRSERFQRVSDRFSAAACLPKEQLVGLDFNDFLRLMVEEGDPVLDELKQDIARHQTFSGVELRVSIDGIERFWRLTGKPIVDEFGAYAGYIGTASDVTAEKNSERRINFLAHNDALTGLLNRAKFTEHLKLSIARLERYGSPFSVLYLDLDQFKAVNDSRGHLIGDKLLVKASKRIRTVLREVDIAARLGGDEFAIILNNSGDASETAALARRLVETISRPYQFDDEIVSIGVSIGIAVAPLNGTRADQILRNADLALYRAKAEGRCTFRFFESQMDSEMRARRMLELELRQALKEQEFVLHYQPLVAAENNKPTGFEALVRWNHPVRGLVSAAEFIPIAEQSGLIKQIGDWTIREACHAAARWPEDLTVAVNLSARHFQMSDIVAVVRDALDASKLAPHRLELEVTESLLIEHPDVVERLAEIKALGATIALDDFGTGYSSLLHLLKFPFDKLKIDKSFVTASTDDAVARDVLKAIAALGKTLKIGITAEGVETEQQVDFLRGIACTDLQGFYFAKPLNELELARYFLAQFDKVISRDKNALPEVAA
ncbi:EAL domain-containing protein [Mesorhizobium sp. BAC0120]|uniref:putative bifunctional diguanylate cyclase/phosphodiesterase n=1 Tax=Mesorhizobium sp. BAC0120 TaxID=3090670 RepID=UPI00298C1D59|nr:EAL domain-containing protein [Mesorhizobium sp. BAC0120]MDW6025777.1 EAL domain-containing protein [Mesorhizobium sp. BAC0120]